MWGRWFLDSSLGVETLNIKFTDNFTYDIPLNVLGNISEREHWLVHMAEKRFIEDTDIADLRRAFNDLFPNN